jgi:hypothetical protein
MKKNYTMVFAVVTVLIALCAFWGCSSSDDDDGPSLPNAEEAGLGDVEISIAAGEQVYETNGTTPYTFAPGPVKTVKTYASDTGLSYISDVVAAGSEITYEGKLTLKLPVFTHWDDTDVDIWHTEMEGLTANPSDVKTFHVGSFAINSGELDLGQTNGTHDVSYVYADKDATIQGVTNEDGMTFHVNLKLKKGWNSVIGGSSGSGWTMATGTPDGTYKWVVYAD